MLSLAAKNLHHVAIPSILSLSQLISLVITTVFLSGLNYYNYDYRWPGLHIKLSKALFCQKGLCPK